MTHLLKKVLIIFGFLTLSCADYALNWEGSLDAQLRYRPQDFSTAVALVRKNSFSEEAGLKQGDLLLAVDGVNVTGITLAEVTGLIRGPVGSKVRLSVKRGDAVIEIVVERRPIKKKEAAS